LEVDGGKSGSLGAVFFPEVPELESSRPDWVSSLEISSVEVWERNMNI
jgi:hypothetical protein